MNTQQFGRADAQAHAEIMGLVNMLKAATAEFITSSNDIPEAQNRLAAAAAIFSGTLLGQMIVMGVLTDQQQRAMVEIMAANVRQGVRIGKSAATRILIDNTEGRA